MNNKETFECSNAYLCLKITSKGSCEQQHMVTYASSGVPVPQDKPQKMWGLQATSGGSETHTRVIPPNATPCLYATACCPCGWMFKSRNLHPSRLDERLERASQRKKSQHFDTQLPQSGILMSRSKTQSPCSESRCLCSFRVLTFY